MKHTGDLNPKLQKDPKHAEMRRRKEGLSKLDGLNRLNKLNGLNGGEELHGLHGLNESNGLNGLEEEQLRNRFLMVSI